MACVVDNLGVTLNSPLLFALAISWLSTSTPSCRHLCIRIRLFVHYAAFSYSQLIAYFLAYFHQNTTYGSPDTNPTL